MAPLSAGAKRTLIRVARDDRLLEQLAGVW